MTREALDLKISGVVQGVGFRPFVYREAKKRDITGWVLNDVEGVKVHAEGETLPLNRFVLALSEEAPSAAQISEIEIAEVPVQGFDAFEIRFSDAAEQGETTLVSPDLATCDACVEELFDPNNRRSCASCLTTAPKHQWRSLLCVQHARRNIPTPLIGAFMHNPMRALSVALKLAGLNRVARTAFRPKAFPGRKTSRNPTRFSTVPQSLLQKAASLLLRVWADTTWCAMPPTRRHLPHCASANIVPARRLLLWLLQRKRLALFVK